MIRHVGLRAALGLLLALSAGCGGPDDEPDDPAPSAAGPISTVFVGDSITAGVNPTTMAADGVYSW